MLRTKDTKENLNTDFDYSIERQMDPDPFGEVPLQDRVAKKIAQSILKSTEKVQSKKINILLAEDEQEEFLLIAKTLKESGLPYRLKWVKSKNELSDYLYDHTHGDNVEYKPSIILVDLNMCKETRMDLIDGIKSIPGFEDTLVFGLNNSRLGTGIKAYLKKIEQLKKFVETIKVLDDSHLIPEVTENTYQGT